MRRTVRNRKRAGWLARRRRVTRSLEGSDRVRLTVYRSSRHTYAQLFDPANGGTLGAVSTRTPGLTDGLTSTGTAEAARRVGTAIAELARARHVERVVFNRNGFLYHGRIKALAEAARAAGLQL